MEMASSLRASHVSRRQRQEAADCYLFLSPALAGFVLFVAGPMLASLYLSLTRWDVLTSPRFAGLQNYLRLARDPLFLKSLYNSGYYTAFAVPGGLLVALAAALLLNQPLRGVASLRAIYYLPAVVSGVAVALLWRWLLNPDFGVLNHMLRQMGVAHPPLWLQSEGWAKPAFVLMSVWGFGGAMMVFLAGLQQIPKELYEAASMDGASGWARLRFVTLPQLSPVIFFNLTMGIIGAVQIFVNVYVMTDGTGSPSNETLFYVLYLFNNAFRFFRMGYASAMAWVLFVIILLVTALQFRLARTWVYYEAG